MEQKAGYEHTRKARTIDQHCCMSGGLLIARHANGCLRFWLSFTGLDRAAACVRTPPAAFKHALLALRGFLLLQMTFGICGDHRDSHNRKADRSQGSQVAWEPSSAMLSYLSMVRPHVAAPKSVSARLSSNSSREVMAMVSCRVRSAKQDRQHWQEHITTVAVTV